MSPISVIIVGAGPSGLLLARLLAQSGIRDIRLLERETLPTDDHRAVLYQAISLHEFKRAGIIEDFKTAAHRLKSVCWRDAADGGKRLFGMPANDTLLMSVKGLTGIIKHHLARTDQAEILVGHEVVSVGQDATKAWVDVNTPGGRKRMEATYVAACDGASSTVRKSVFGSGSMEGFTWDKQLVAADIRCDASLRFPDIEESNLFIHPMDAWILFALPGETSFWRVIYQDSATTDQELVANAPNKIGRLLSSQSEAPPFEVLAARPYHIHQRLANSMVKGRVVLAADAAHLCCPYGALGLNGGIADVGSLADCLTAINDGKADQSILEVYNRVRREKWQSHIDPVSQRTMKLVYSDPKDIIPDHPIYKMARMREENPQAIQGRAGPDPLVLRYDFSPHYKTE